MYDDTSSFSDLFSSQDSSSVLGDSGSSGIPSIADIKADYVNVDNVVNGKAKSADWGGVVGGITGFVAGGPESAQLGANVGRKVFPMLGDVISSIGDALSNIF